MSPQIMVIDPGVKTPELDTFNNIASMVPVSCGYHLPAMFGFGSFPDQYSEVRAVIILGSASSVHERLPWQVELENRVRRMIDMNIPVLGCCYGHQMLAYMYGGDVAYVKQEQIKLKGVRSVEVLQNPVWNKGVRKMIVTHNEHVTRLPQDFTVIATSREVPIDGLMHKTKRIFGFQSHPEATKNFLEGHEMLDAQSLGALGDGHSIIRDFVNMAIGKSP
jgi:GMP synthase (glutamine-hydrolysing)